jgi:superfamily I DNA/RNA helicase
MPIRVILGPPGTGKTTTLIHEVSDLMGRGVSSEAIGFVSFTRVACQTARDRIAAQFPNLDPDEAFPHFRTIHSMARHLSADGNGAQVMQPRHWVEFGKSFAYTFSAETPDEDVLSFAMLETDADALRQIHSLSRLCRCTPEKAMLRVRQRPRHLTAEHVAIFGRRLAEFKSQHKLRDYTDMLEMARVSPRLPNVSHAFVDEAQDLSPLQNELIDKWFFRNERCVETVVTGDDDQAIFTWAGASPDWLIGLAAQHPTRVLAQSYRIPARVHVSAMSIVQEIVNRVPKLYRPRAAQGEIVSCNDPREALKFVGDGSLAVIARNAGLLETYYKTCVDGALLFAGRAGRKQPLDHKQKKGAFRAVANLRRGVAMHAPDFMDLLHFIPSTFEGRTIVPRGMKTKATANERPVTLQRARDEFGCGAVLDDLLRQDNPFDALPRFSEDERRYLGRILARHPSGILPDPKITLSTIHRFKGDEADTIVLVPDMYGASYSELLNGDRASEHRCAYVAITRPKERLVLMQPERPRNYPYAHHVRRREVAA